MDELVLDPDLLYESTDISIDYTTIEDRKDFSLFMDYCTLILSVVETVAVLGTTSIYAFMFVQFKKLRTRPNVIFLNFFICASAFAVNFSLQSAYILFIQPDGWSEKDENVVFTFVWINLIVFQASTFQMVFLVLDWFITALPWRFRDKYQKNYHWILGVIYIDSIANVFTDIHFKHYILLYIFPVYLSTPFILVSSLVVVSILCLVYKCTNYSQEVRKTAYRLPICLTFFVLWNVHLAYTFAALSYIARLDSLTTAFGVFLFEKIIVTLCGLYAVFMFFWLVKRDNHLKSCFEHTLRKSVRQYVRNENLDDEESFSVHSVQ